MYRLERLKTKKDFLTRRMNRKVITVYWSLCITLVIAILQPVQCFSPAPIDNTAHRVGQYNLLLNALSDDDDNGDDDISLEAFQARKREQQEKAREEEIEETFDGYAMRDVILEKWGKCYDVDFNRVDSFGFRNLYLNIMPFHLGGRRFRHETELDYLCHLQAVVEILEKYGQIPYVLAQIDETKKKPRAGTSPLVAVPLRLDLSREQVEEIIGY